MVHPAIPAAPNVWPAQPLHLRRPASVTGRPPHQQPPRRARQHEPDMPHDAHNRLPARPRLRQRPPQHRRAKDGAARRQRRHRVHSGEPRGRPAPHGRAGHMFHQLHCLDGLRAAIQQLQAGLSAIPSSRTSPSTAATGRAASTICVRSCCALLMVRSRLALLRAVGGVFRDMALLGGVGTIGDYMI
ncbi:hypothetical protein AOQ84DRAFT_197716 [Glonium stellatum]|uniref:Uncharacterized protein n=1 Tax=Glonium stellatum TaxID=574774 RepID=A0A8E2ENJ3_9PEZI|nr:hypothetical protein AOQ84DRAFT_197716 [Glonium stellatum]